jgi:hypothetical protein
VFKYLRALNLHPLPLPHPLPTYQPQLAGFMQNADRLLQSFTKNSQVGADTTVKDGLISIGAVKREATIDPNIE